MFADLQLAQLRLARTPGSGISSNVLNHDFVLSLIDAHKNP
jgi:hypothetical protein